MIMEIPDVFFVAFQNVFDGKYDVVLIIFIFKGIQEIEHFF